MHIIEETQHDLKTAKFIRGLCCAAHLIEKLGEGEGQESYFAVVRTIIMNEKEYVAFAQDLKAEQIWLEEFGGYLSKDESNPHEFTTPEELETWEELSYRECVQVKTNGYPTLIVDAQTKGHPVWGAAIIESGN